MHHRGTVPLETEHLVLRRFSAGDTEAAFRNWTSDPQVTEFLRWPAHPDVRVTEGVLGAWIADYKRVDFYQWAIVPKELGEPIGTISVVSMDERTDTVHIGYCIGRNWWHRGYTSEALAAVMDFLFTRVGVGRMEAWHDPDNPRSGGVMKKCGMTYEGTLRRADWSNRGIVDACVYSILAGEYFDR